MSILLDALRKSEEQRKLGSTPSIHNGPDLRPGGGDSVQQWIPLSLIALSAIAMAWIGWHQYRQPADLPAVMMQERVAAGAGSAAAPRDDAGTAGPAERTEGSGPDGPRLAPRTPVESYAQADVTPQAHPQMAPPEALTTAAPKARVTASGPPSEPPGEPTGPDIALEPPPAGPPGTDTAPARSGPERSASEPITFWELPQGVRDSLPELRITVLVFAEQPQDRFVLMSGQRLVEKDEYEGGVVLEEIRRDGAVFLYRNYRFLVKG